MHFVSMGSGQALADPFLAFVSRVFWKNETPTVKSAKLGVYWVLDHTIKCAPGGVGEPIKLAVLKKDKHWNASLIEDGELEEIAESIQEIENRISNPSDMIDEAKPSELPSPPGS